MSIDNTKNPTKHLANDRILEDEEQRVMDALATEQDAVTEPKAPEVVGEEAPTESTEEETPESTNDEDEAEDKNEDEVKSARGQKRVQNLANEAARVPELEAELKRLQKVLEINSRVDADALKPQSPQAPQTNLPWSENNGEEKSMTQEELDAYIERKNLESEQRRTIKTRVDQDIFLIEDTYPEFRPPTDDNPNPLFDEQLVKKTSDIYRAMFAQDPTVRLKDTVDWLMSLRSRGEEQGKRKVEETIRRQSAEQAIDPSASPTKSTNDNVESKIRRARNSDDLAALEKLLPHAD